MIACVHPRLPCIFTGGRPFLWNLVCRGIGGSNSGKVTLVGFMRRFQCITRNNEFVSLNFGIEKARIEQGGSVTGYVNDPIYYIRSSFGGRTLNNANPKVTGAETVERKGTKGSGSIKPGRSLPRDCDRHIVLRKRSVAHHDLADPMQNHFGRGSSRLDGICSVRVVNILRPGQ
jgi:hypothetical protein